MRILAKSIAFAAVVEALFVWMFFGTGWGPCGPGSALGYLALLAHLFPGLTLAMLADKFHAGKITSDAILVGGQFCFWALLAWLELTARARRKRHAP